MDINEEVTMILRERGFFDENAEVRGIFPGEKPATALEIADSIQKALSDVLAGGGKDIDLNY